MPVIWTRKEILDLIADWKQAYKAASAGKSYTIGSRSLTYQDLGTILAQLRYLQSELDALDGRPSGIRFIRMRSAR